MICVKHDKHLYTSVRTARAALTGQLRSKRIRVYPCDANKGLFHVTKDRITTLDHSNKQRHGHRNPRKPGLRTRPEDV